MKLSFWAMTWLCAAVTSATCSSPPAGPQPWMGNGFSGTAGSTGAAGASADGMVNAPCGR